MLPAIDEFHINSGFLFKETIYRNCTRRILKQYAALEEVAKAEIIEILLLLSCKCI